MAEGDDLFNEAFLYVSEKKYPDKACSEQLMIMRSCHIDPKSGHMGLREW